MAMTYWHWWLLMGVLQCWVWPKSCLRRLSTVSMRLADHLELAHSYKWSSYGHRCTGNGSQDTQIISSLSFSRLFASEQVLDCAVYHHHVGYPSD
ncbi:MAG: hypothetical protein NXY57DRAFT_349743 [Lentinula lateritia]|uniref:Secreted protein n=1 Tax=Lentinula lateritia TaxID=40482 RepID=A0ABQ8V5U0_9AGAR|nr:MAG: hypothetical protein NXY57DRAFT_349743 [Lentinula lateritia]KAJ4475879.1 hypothetical protein C8R41DRAFT_545565 [Lentinula lateritia]